MPGAAEGSSAAAQREERKTGARTNPPGHGLWKEGRAATDAALRVHLAGGAGKGGHSGGLPTNRSHNGYERAGCILDMGSLVGGHLVKSLLESSGDPPGAWSSLPLPLSRDISFMHIKHGKVEGPFPSKILDFSLYSVILIFFSPHTPSYSIGLYSLTSPLPHSYSHGLSKWQGSIRPPVN